MTVMRFKKGQRIRLPERHHEQFGRYAIITGEVEREGRYYAVPIDGRLGTNGGRGWHWSEDDLAFPGWCAECDTGHEDLHYLCAACRGKLA